MCWVGPQLLMVVLTQECLKLKMFDSERNEWTEVSQIPVERFESQEEINKGKKFKACSASFSKKVINKRKQLD